MVSMAGDSLEKLAPLFEGWEETLVWSVLQGCMGRAWADSRRHPQAALLWVGDFFFLGGDPACPGAEELAGYCPEVYTGAEMLLVPQNQDWQRLIETTCAGRVQTITRYAIKKEPGVFDKAALRANLDRLPQGFSLRPIDRELYERVLAQAWARDFCANFSSWEEYAAHGLGVVALHEEELAAGASSYTWYKGGIEIEIDTKEEFRRRGLALCCASALILRCLERNLYPSWDAATPISAALAERLGYHFSREYPCCVVTRERK